MTRTLCINELRFGETKFLMHSVVDPWGEDDPLIAEAMAGGFDEVETLGLWSYLVSTAGEGDLFLDVGSYAGLFSLLAARQNGAIKVAAYEASSVTYGRLVSNIILNGVETQVCAGHMAAWDSDTVLRFPHRYGIYSMCPGESAVGDTDVDHEEQVFASRLDDLLKDGREIPGAFGSRALGITGFRRVVGIKIDVEGAEARVIKGALGLLARHSPVILCEILHNDRVAEMEAILGEVGYKVSRIGDERNYILCRTDSLAALRGGYEAWVGKVGRDRLSVSAARTLSFVPSAS